MRKWRIMAWSFKSDVSQSVNCRKSELKPGGRTLVLLHADCEHQSSSSPSSSLWAHPSLSFRLFHHLSLLSFCGRVVCYFRQVHWSSAHQLLLCCGLMELQALKHTGQIQPAISFYLARRSTKTRTFLNATADLVLKTQPWGPGGLWAATLQWRAATLLKRFSNKSSKSSIHVFRTEGFTNVLHLCHKVTKSCILQKPRTLSSDTPGVLHSIQEVVGKLETVAGWGSQE